MTRLAVFLLLLAACGSAPEAPAPQATVLLFITTDCPIANSYAPEIQRILADYGGRGLGFALVYTDLTQTPDQVRRHAADYGYTAPARLDAGRFLSRKYGVTVTPEAVVLGSNGARVYRGRIDDRYSRPGQYRMKPTTHELRDAIDAVLAGRPVAVSEMKAVGCPLTD